MNPPSDLLNALAPTGMLRAAINLGNPILAARAGQGGAVQGVSVDLAQALAQRLGVALSLVVAETASASVDAVRSGQADVGFFAIDPLRGEGIAFTAPYLLIEGAYAVPEHSALQRNEDVDQPGVRVVVGQGSAYDLFLTRALQAAQIVRAPSSPAVFEVYRAQQLEVAAGVKQQLQADLSRTPGHRLLPGRFMVIQQAMGLAKVHGPQAAAALAAFVEDMKAQGQVAQALSRHGIAGASVAPAGAPPA